jgi:hypothetical protein
MLRRPWEWVKGTQLGVGQVTHAQREPVGSPLTTPSATGAVRGAAWLGAMQGALSTDDRGLLQRQMPRSR